eukprot:11349611-Heterocapsa_arctica.AAC.1
MKSPLPLNLCSSRPPSSRPPTRAYPLDSNVQLLRQASRLRLRNPSSSQVAGRDSQPALDTERPLPRVKPLAEKTHPPVDPALHRRSFWNLMGAP